MGRASMSSSSRWISAGILALAFILRIWALDIKPAHFDEGVNGYFVDQMTRQGFYHYDPHEFPRAVPFLRAVRFANSLRTQLVGACGRRSCS